MVARKAHHKPEMYPGSTPVAMLGKQNTMEPEWILAQVTVPAIMSQQSSLRVVSKSSISRARMRDLRIAPYKTRTGGKGARWSTT
jgi:hypothetical protein